MPRFIIRGQQISPELIRCAAELRRQMTPEERILWEILRRNGLGVHFRRSQPIAGYIADFYCHSARLVVEVDGSAHQRQQGYDKFRDASLEKLGLRVLRLSNHQIRNELPAVIVAIRAALT